MAENDAPETPEVTETKSRSPLLLIIIAVVLVCIAGAGVGIYLFMQKGGDAPAAGTPKTAPQNDGAVMPIGHVIALDPFIVNLAGNSRSYLKVSMALEVSDPVLEEQIANKMPKIQDTILFVLSSKTHDEIVTTEGKTLLKDELLMRLNTFVAGGTIQNIYFTSFVIQ